jgi:hypothetical protein
MNSSGSLPPLPVSPGVFFRHCPGHAGVCVGSDGSVWCCWSTGGERWTLKAQRANDGGYKRINLSDGQSRKSRKKKQLMVHHLVLRAFVGPCPAGMQTRHLDGNPANNRLDNLCWGTPKENAEDCARHRAARLAQAGRSTACGTDF